MKTQNQKIKAYLEIGGKITAIKALTMFDCFRLAGRIYDLRKQGMKINVETITTKSGKIVAEYSL